MLYIKERVVKLNSEPDFMQEEVSLDLTPLIDIIFMLVIFFILTMSFSKPVLDIVLPKSQNASVATQDKIITIKISADNLYFYEEKIITIEEISALLDVKNDHNLNLYPDKDIKFQSFIDLVDLAQKKRAGRFAVTAIKEP